MPYADYTFYVFEYHGTSIGEVDFPRLAARASAYLDYISCGYAAGHPEEAAVKLAACAVAEAWQTNESGGEVVSESMGRWSRTFSTGNKTNEDRLLEAARLYLKPVGAMGAAWV